MMTMRIASLGALIALLALSASTTQANLITNGGFEQPGTNGDQPTGWTSSGTEIQTQESPAIPVAPIFGDFAVRFSGNLESYFYQSFSTVNGQTYDLSFYLAKPNGSNPFDVYVDVFDGIQTLDDTGTGGLLRDDIIGADVTDTGVWQQFTYQFTATSSNATLRFLDNDGSTNVDPLIDNVVVTPEPATMALLGIGGLAILRRRKR